MAATSILNNMSHTNTYIYTQLIVIHKQNKKDTRPEY